MAWHGKHIGSICWNPSSPYSPLCPMSPYGHWSPEFWASPFPKIDKTISGGIECLKLTLSQSTWVKFWLGFNGTSCDGISKLRNFRSCFPDLQETMSLMLQLREGAWTCYPSIPSQVPAVASQKQSRLGKIQIQKAFVMYFCTGFHTQKNYYWPSLFCFEQVRILAQLGQSPIMTRLGSHPSATRLLVIFRD